MTSEEYKENLLFLSMTQPNHPLLDELKEGYSAENVIYLEYILKNSENTAEIYAEDVTLPEELYEQKQDENTIVKSLYIQKKQYFDQRRTYSNKFHECETDAQRKANSTHITYIQDKIEQAMRKLKAYEETGRLPLDDNSDEIENDNITGIDLSRKLLSVRSNLSREKNKAEKLLGLPDGPKKDDKIEAIQKRIRDLEIQKMQLEARIKTVKEKV